MTRFPAPLRRLIALLPLLLAAAWGVGAAPPAASASKAGKLTVYFFDIGQGDAQLIISPAGKTVLIDGGPPDAGPRLAARLRELVHKPLDLVIMTHPHADHLGGLVDAVQAVGAKRFLEPGFDHPSAGYRRLLEVMGATVEQRLYTADPAKPQDLVGISLGEDTKLWLLWPRIGPKGERVEEFLKDTRSDVNSNSVVAKLVYGKTAFLFVGDAEPDTEDYLIQKNIDFTSTVLKVGHHGGRHSSTSPFLEKVKARAGVISCGLGNDYGHPTEAAMSRIRAGGAHIFRTDQDGEVVAVSDGTSVRISSERRTEGPEAISFVGETLAAVATGPILPGERRPSASTLEDRQRYGKHRGSAPDHSQGTGREASAADAGARPAPSVVEAVIPQEVKERYPPPVAGGQVRYVASRKSKVFHQLDCAAVATIKPANRLTFTSRAEAAKSRGPAGDCNP